MSPKNRKFRLIPLLILVGLIASFILSFGSKLLANSPSDYEISSQAPFNQLSYYSLAQKVDPQPYKPSGNWVGRLILPTQAEIKREGTQNSDWVWLEVYCAPGEYQKQVGEILRLTWKPSPSQLAYVKLLTVGVNFTEATQKSLKSGNIVPTRLNGWKSVGPLQSLAGSRPKDDVLVSFDTGVLLNPKTLQIERMPILVPAPLFGLVKFISPIPSKNAPPSACPGQKPCPSELFRVRHYNPASGDFDGQEEIVRIPQQPSLPSSRGRFASTPRQLVDSPVGKAGWYIYGARDTQGQFTIRSIKPRSLFQLKPTTVILGEKAGLSYINQGNWENTPARKGTAQRVLVSPTSATEKAALAEWQEGDYGLVMHLFGGVGGEKR
jgi:predicted Abi (CAAX) family protease